MYKHSRIVLVSMSHKPQRKWNQLFWSVSEKVKTTIVNISPYQQKTLSWSGIFGAKATNFGENPQPHVVKAQNALTTDLRPGAFFSMFLVTRPRSFSLKSKKKKREDPGDVKINLKVVDLALRSATGAQDLHVTLAVDWTSSRLLRGGGRRTFSFCVVWSK